MKQLCHKCDRYAAVLRSGLSHPKPRSATAPLTCYNSGAFIRLSYPQRQATSRRCILSRNLSRRLTVRIKRKRADFETRPFTEG